MRFKIGDVVRVTQDKPDSPAGSIGTVLEDSPAPWLAMRHETDNVWNGHKNADCIEEHCLELIEPGSACGDDSGEMPAPADEPPGSGNSVAADSLPRTTDPHERLEFNLSAAQEQTPLLDKYFSVQETLQERGSRYGDFTENARISQQLKSLMAGFSGWGELNYVQREALTMIAQKIARILNGDPNYRDNWHDIQGYARLAEERCK